MDVLQYVLTAVVVGLVLGAMARSARQPPVVTGDAIVLRYPRGLRWFLWFSAVLMLGMLAWLVFEVASEDRDPGIVRLAWFGIPLFGVLGAVSLREPRVRLEIDGDGIRGETAFRGRRELAWRDLASVRYSPTWNWFVLRDRDGRLLRVSPFLRGSEALFAALEAKVPDRIWSEALGAWRRRHVRR